MNEEIIKNYFEAWQNYDLNLLAKIFDKKANYIIKNKLLCYCGIKRITDYWIRNSHRQKDLKLEWKIVSEEDKVIKAIFNATFFDVEEKKVNYINGNIYFYVDENNKIYKLSEFYTKKAR